MSKLVHSGSKNHLEQSYCKLAGIIAILLWSSVFVDLNSPLLFGRLNGLSSDSTIDILYQLGTTQDSGTRDRYNNILFLPQLKLSFSVPQ